MKPTAVAVLVLLLLAPSVISQGPDDKLIVPGQRIGKWTLEMTIDDLARVNDSTKGRHLFKAGYKAGGEDMADTVRDLTEVWWDGFAPLPVSAFTGDQKTVVILIISTRVVVPGGELYRTDTGIGLKSTRDQVLKAYGKPTAETAPEVVQKTLIYDKIGIAFRVWNYGAMRGIWVFHPQTAKTIWKF